MHDDVTGRLAARTLELVDIPSESRDEARARRARARRSCDDARRRRARPRRHLRARGCLAGPRPAGRPLVMLAGHLDTVPAQGNRPGRPSDGAVHGLGASDMKAALRGDDRAGRDWTRTRAVDLGYLFFGREELPGRRERAHAAARARAGVLDADLVLMMEPTDNTIHAGLPRATSTRPGPSAAAAGTPAGRGRPTTRSTARPAGSRRSPICPTSSTSSTGWCSPRRCRSRGSRAGSPTTSSPTSRRRTSTTATRPAARADEAEARLRELCEPPRRAGDRLERARRRPWSLDHAARRARCARRRPAGPRQAGVDAGRRVRGLRACRR